MRVEFKFWVFTRPKEFLLNSHKNYYWGRRDAEKHQGGVGGACGGVGDVGGDIRDRTKANRGPCR